MSGAHDPRIGTELAGYRIEAFLGAGGMGVVYRALDPRLERSVALKLLPASHADDPSYRRRFLDESRRAAAIEHPHIVPVHEAGEVTGVLYIAMRYVEGADLAGLLEQRGALEPTRTVALLAPIADALDTAHARGLVHRDVKPSNVLVASDAIGAEHVYLTDFGIAKRFAGAQTDSATGHMLGTADYVAPEQVEGDDLDGRADVYSLACVLFECLAGAPPFRRETPVATLVAHAHEPPPSLSARRPDLPAAIDEVLERALAKAPRDRFDTCTELVEAAGAALGVAAVPAERRARLRPRALDEHCRAVIEAMMRGRVVPVIGTRANRSVPQDTDAQAPPDADQLAVRLRDLFAYPTSEAAELTRVSQYVAVMRGEGPLHDELHDLLDADYAPGAVHRLMAGLPALLRGAGGPCPLIVTANCDEALERAFREAGEELDVVSYVASGRDRGKFWHLAPDGSATLVEVPNTYAAALALDRRAVLLKLHGRVDRSLEREFESFVVTEDDYIGYLARTEVVSAVPVSLAARLRRSHFLFLGYSPRDWSSRVILDRLWGERPLAYRCWAVASELDPVEEEFWRYRDVEVVRVPLVEYVSALDEHARVLAGAAS
jgi:serine/threonine-protein kinase